MYTKIEEGGPSRRKTQITAPEYGEAGAMEEVDNTRKTQDPCKRALAHTDRDETSPAKDDGRAYTHSFTQ